MRRAAVAVLALAALVGLAALGQWLERARRAPPGLAPAAGGSRAEIARGSGATVLEAGAPDSRAAPGRAASSESAARPGALRRARDGVLVTGRVVDVAGRPVENARVQLERQGGDGRAGRTDDGLTDSEGVYRLQARVVGSYRLFARHGGAGAGGLCFDVRPEEVEKRPPDLVLEPSALLTGRLRYPDWSPVPEMELTAEQQGFVTAGGPGARTARTKTDADGRFRFAGLAPGFYRVSWPRHGVPGGRSEELQTGPSSHDVVCDASRVLLAVERTEGAPSRFNAFCQVVGPDGLVLYGPGSFTTRSTAAGGTSWFSVTPGGRFAIGLERRGRSYAERIVEVPESPGDVEVFLKPLRSNLTGELELAVRDHAGRPTADFCVAVRSALTGRQLQVERGSDLSRGAGPPRLELLPGRYRIQFWPSEKPTGPPALEREVGVRGGGRTPVDVRLAAAELRLRLELTEQAREELTRMNPAEPARTLGLQIELDGVHLPTVRDREDPTLLHAWGLAPGDHGLAVRGFRIEDIERTVTLDAGRTTELVLPLRERR